MKLLQLKNNDGTARVVLLGDRDEPIKSATIDPPLSSDQLYQLQAILDIMDDMIDALIEELEEAELRLSTLEYHRERNEQLEAEVKELEEQLRRLESYADKIEAALRKTEDELYDYKHSKDA